MPARIVEGQLPYTGGTGIEIDTNKVISLLLREENNLIMVNSDNEVYTDLQLQSGLNPSSDFPVGVTTGKVLQSDGWEKSGLILNWKTTSGDYARWIYATDGEIYFDNGTGTWKQVYYSSEVDALLQQLRNYIDLNFQPKLTAGAGITIDQNNVISAQGAGTGDVSGPITATDGHLAVFDGNTGKAIKDGGPVPTQVTVVDNLTSTSTTSALSANQGKILNDKISTLAGLGKFLSLWDCTTGQPISFPYATPYAYTTGDYFIIEAVSSVTPAVNYRPDGSSYTGSASSVTESDEVEVGDVYVYDGTVWLLQSNHGKTVSFGNIAGQPSDNANLDIALNSKQPKVIDVTVTTAYNTGAKVGTTTGGSYTPTSGDLLLVNFVNGCKIANPTLNIDGSGAINIRIGGDNASTATFDLGSTASSNVKVLLYYNGTYYQAWSTTNNTYTSMTVAEGKTGTATISRTITASNLKEIVKYHAVDDTAFGASWDGVTGIAPSKNAVYDKISTMDTTIAEKQDKLTAGDNIQISSSNVISATDTKYNAGEGISIGNVTKNGRQGPSPDGFHVPAITEWQGLKTIMDGLSLTTGDNWRINLHMPFAGFRDYVDGVVYGQVLYAYYWSSSPYSDYPDYPRSLQLNSSNVNANFDDCSYAFGLSVRSFKNEYVAPDSSWTVVQGILGSAGIFWNQSEGLISITDGSTGYTIMDKNLGATTVYNDGDTLTQANMGNMYQWGNNYGFPSTGTITNTSSTQVDASAYGPNTANGYYSSDTFITGSEDWSSVYNYDLRGDTTGIYTQENVISNTGVTSINGQTGNITIATGLQVAPNSPITGIKYIRYGTEAQYAALTQYYTDTPGDTEFHCF